MNIILKDQECEGNFNFANASICMTRHFSGVFGLESLQIIDKALSLICNEYGRKADYLPSLTYEEKNKETVKFWAVHDGEHVTFMLPSDY